MTKHGVYWRWIALVKQVDALRTIIRAMGKTTFHKHMFFKFQSSQSKFLPYFRRVCAKGVR